MPTQSETSDSSELSPMGAQPNLRTYCDKYMCYVKSLSFEVISYLAIDN